MGAAAYIYVGRSVVGGYYYPESVHSYQHNVYAGDVNFGNSSKTP